MAIVTAVAVRRTEELTSRRLRGALDGKAFSAPNEIKYTEPYRWSPFMPESEQQSRRGPGNRLDDSEAESLRQEFRRSKVADAFTHDVIQRIGEIISRAMGIRPRR